MPRYQIACQATVNYYVVVEAPNEKAAFEFYDKASGTEFDEVGYDSWNLQGIEELSPTDPGTPKYKLNAEGKIILNP